MYLVPGSRWINRRMISNFCDGLIKLTADAIKLREKKKKTECQNEYEVKFNNEILKDI